MADSELKCLHCKENLNISVGKDERFSVLCIANDWCPEKEDRNLEEKLLCVLTKKQFHEIL